jgi:hypothetical protein
LAPWFVVVVVVGWLVGWRRWESEGKGGGGGGWVVPVLLLLLTKVTRQRMFIIMV